jgi:hypothetical protein
MQQGRIADAEIAVRQLWGKAKVESSMADLKASSVETVKGDNQDAGWGELFGKRYRKGTDGGLGLMGLTVVGFVADVAYMSVLWMVLSMRCLGAVVTVGMAMFLFQQFAGINAVVYFSTQVFRSAGITSDVAASALVGAANVIGGKRSLLMLSLSICPDWAL